MCANETKRNGKNINCSRSTRKYDWIVVLLRVTLMCFVVCDADKATNFAFAFSGFLFYFFFLCLSFLFFAIWCRPVVRTTMANRFSWNAIWTATVSIHTYLCTYIYSFVPSFLWCHGVSAQGVLSDEMWSNYTLRLHTIHQALTSSLFLSCSLALPLYPNLRRTTKHEN